MILATKRKIISALASKKKINAYLQAFLALVDKLCWKEAATFMQEAAFHFPEFQ